MLSTKADDLRLHHRVQCTPSWVFSRLKRRPLLSFFRNFDGPENSCGLYDARHPFMNEITELPTRSAVIPTNRNKFRTIEITFAVKIFYCSFRQNLALNGAPSITHTGKSQEKFKNWLETSPKMV